MWVVALCFMSINISGAFCAVWGTEQGEKAEMGQNWKVWKAVPVWKFSPLCVCLLYVTKAPSAIEKRECFSHLHNTALSFVWSVDDCFISIVPSLTWDFLHRSIFRRAFILSNSSFKREKTRHHLRVDVPALCFCFLKAQSSAGVSIGCMFNPQLTSNHQVLISRSDRATHAATKVGFGKSSVRHI